MNTEQTNFYDTHIHALGLKNKSPEFFDAFKTALANHSIAQCIDIGLDLEDISIRMPILRDLSVAWYSLGLYPSHAADVDWERQVADLRSLVGRHLDETNGLILAAPRLVAIGEIGVDLFHKYADVEIQKSLFKAQIEIANEFNLPIVVHNRNADDAVLEIVSQHPPHRGGILHCFSSSLDFAHKMCDLGLHVSFAGNLTYRSSEGLREIAKKIPAGRLLCETDSPYLAPDPYRGKVNWPGNVEFVYRCLAEIRGQPIDHFCEQIEENLFSLIGS